MIVTSYSLLLCARAKIAPCPEPDRSWPRRFEVRRTKSVFVLSSWYRGPSTTSIRHSKTTAFLKGRLARAVMARDAKMSGSLDSTRSRQPGQPQQFNGDVQGFCASHAMWTDPHCGFLPLSSKDYIGIGNTAMDTRSGNVVVSSPKCIGIHPRQSVREAPLLRCESFPHDGPLDT